VAQSFQSCCSTISNANTGTLVSLIGTKIDGVPAGGTGWTEKCLHTNSEERKSCCASLLAKQTSTSDMLARGTRPTAVGGMLVAISRAQPCLYPEGRGMNAE